MSQPIQSSPGRQKGFSAIIAIVLIVILALLGAYAATTVGVQSLSTTQSVGGMQAWFAARAGIDRGIAAVLDGGGCGSVPGTPLALNGGGFDGFSVTELSCSSATVQEGPDSYDVYQLRATASRGGNAGDIAYVSRTVEVTVSDSP